MYVQFNVLTLALLFSKLKVKISGKNPLEPFEKQGNNMITGRNQIHVHVCRFTDKSQLLHKTI